MKLSFVSIVIICLVMFQGLLCSCKLNEAIEYTYYDSGKLKSKVIYPDKTDTTSFQAFIYYENGNLSHQAQFNKGKRTGQYLSYYENGNLNESYNYENGRLHGIIKRFTDTGEQTEESFYIDGKHILIKTFSVNPKFNLTRSQIFFVNGDKIEEIGMLVYDNDKNIIENGSFFYETYGPDVIKFNQENEFVINFYNKREDFILELQIGDLDSDLNFIIPNNVIKYSTELDMLPYNYIPEKPGYNLIVGKLFLINDSILLEYPYYFEFFAEK